MRDAAMKEFVKLAATSGPLGAIVTDSVEDGVVVASKLIDNLKAADMHVEFKPGKNGHFVNVYKSGSLQERVTAVREGVEDGSIDPDAAPEDDRVLVAFGYSNTETDAIKQAMFGAVKEEEAGRKAAA